MELPDGGRAGVRAGDHDAFAAVFDAHSGTVYGYVLRATADRATAEDVLSLTFLEARRLRSRLQPNGGPLRPWQFGIATNVLRDTARSAPRHRATLDRLPPPMPVPDFSDDLVGATVDAAALRAA
jgi:RNA polymerase sigma-70 factor (ECF subfamily)